MVEIEILRAELERLFELEDLLALSRDVLGLDPEELGGNTAKGTFAGILTDHCLENDAVEALCDAVLATRRDASAELSRLRATGLSFDDGLPPDQAFGPFENLKELAQGRLAITYLAERSGHVYRVKVLRKETTRDRRGLQRFMTVTRLVGSIDHANLPHRLEAGAVGGRPYVAHEHVSGFSLAELLGRRGPLPFSQIEPVLRAILAGLSALHARRIAHGDLSLDNVIVPDSEMMEDAVLVDVGSDRLRARPRLDSGRSELFSTASSPKTVSPEQIRGLPADPRSDVYSLGAMLYELSTGKPPFGEGDALEAAFGHLSRDPVPPSQVGPQGLISPRTDELLLGMLAKDPDARPADADQVLELVEEWVRAAAATRDSLTPAATSALIDHFLANPTDDESAMTLESAAEGPDLSTRIGDAFQAAADALPDDEDSTETKKSLLFRAARVYAGSAETREKAEPVYQKLLDIAPDDEVAATGMMELRRRLGKHEEVVEMLLGRTESAPSKSEKARIFAQIGRLYARDLADEEQALVAFTQAFCEDPSEPDFAKEIERIAGSKQQAWGEVLQSCAATAQEPETPAEDAVLILNRTGRWWVERVQRPDLALQCFQAVLNVEPSNDAALEGLSQIYRKAQQWQELGMVLTRRAEAAPTPARARDFRAEAAELLEVYLGDSQGARVLYEQIVSQDPAHAKALSPLAKLYEKTKDFTALVNLLERSAEAQRAEERTRTLCRIAAIYEIDLNDDDEAIRRYNVALDQDSHSLDALRGLDRLYSKAGRFQDLLDNLQWQLELSATPRQKIALLERIASIHEEEFLDHQKAAASLERLLELDQTHRGALSALARHYRATDRWEDVVALYERHQKLLTEPAERIPVLLQQARVLADQIGSPERALKAYEAALELDPGQGEALEAVAKLREQSGDADAALAAIEALANQATTPEARAEQWVRAAKQLEAHGDRDGAIERYKRALDAHPKDPIATAGLRDAFAARGDVHSAIQLLERELEHTEGDLAKAKLAGRMALLYEAKLKDHARAEEMAKRAIALDATSTEALTVLADLAFDGGRFLEAASHYKGVVERADTLDRAEATRVLVRYVDALSQTGSTEQALAAMDTLLRIAPDDLEALDRVAHVTFEHGSPERASSLYRTLVDRFSDKLAPAAKTRTLYRLGESLRRDEKLDLAIQPLEEAADLDPMNAEPLIALARIYESQEKWPELAKIKTRHLDVATGEERVQLLVELGEISATRLDDRTQAAKSLVAALDERPDDRRLLMKLMQLYSEEKDWNKLVDVVLRLAEFVDDPSQKVKYLHTAAIVTARQIGDSKQALEYYDRVLDLDPKFERALDEVIEIQEELGEHATVERLLKRKLDLATGANDQAGTIRTFDALGQLYEKKLGWIDQAVDAYEAAQTLDPDNPERTTLLGNLYASDPERYLEKAVLAEHERLRQNPYRVESFRTLRRLYTETKRADSAWCVCQALSVLNLAEPDEERFYKRMRSDTAAPAQAALSDDAWLSHVMHADADPLLTSLFALIEPAVIAARSQSLQELGYDPSWRVDLTEHPAPVCQSLYYASGVLGVPPPPTYQNQNDPGGVALLFTHEPSLVLGRTGLRSDVPLQPAAFIAARQLAYLRAGMYIRHLLASGTALKAWLFATIKLASPQFPVAAELEGAVKEALGALEAGIRGQTRDQLTRVVSKLLSSGAALDLKRWVAGVDMTADRAGFIIAHDLETTLDVVRASGDTATAVPLEERVKELVVYSVSPEYFEIRHQLGIAIDS